MSQLNWKMIAGLLGLLLILVGIFMSLCILCAWYYGEDIWQHFATSAGISLGFGGFLRVYSLSAKNKDISKRDGYLIVTLGWISMAAFGSLPFIISGYIPNPADAFFETMSGFTTTGATILKDIEALPQALIFWRSMTQWIGGMGIIVLTIAILPILGIGGMQLFVAESPGVSPDKLHPRITETAKRLWFVYFLLTMIEATLLHLGGMSLFDAVNHSFTTMATGGFSPRNASIAAYDSPYIHYVITFFMFLAGANFTLIFLTVMGKFRKPFQNEEFRAYLTFTVVISLIAGLSLFLFTNTGFEKSMRDGAFQVVSIITTTGYATADYTQWTPFLIFLLFILFFVGGSSGSTAGSIKIVRHVVMIKNSRLELKRQLHPSAVIPVRINSKAVPPQITYNIAAFVFIYLLVFLIGSLVMSIQGHDFLSATGAVLATLGNVGPGFGTVGPVDNFAHMSVFGKWFLSFLMLVGRLELFTVLILFTPYFWRRR